MVAEAFGNDPFRTAKLTVIGAIHAMIMHDIPQRFPELRIGAIEVAAQWVPHVVRDILLRNRKRGVESDGDLLQANRVLCRLPTDDDLPYVIEHAGEDMIMIGSDYGHADNASDCWHSRACGKRARCRPTSSTRSCTRNPTRFYGLSED